MNSPKFQAFSCLVEGNWEDYVFNWATGEVAPFCHPLDARSAAYRLIEGTLRWDIIDGKGIPSKYELPPRDYWKMK